MQSKYVGRSVSRLEDQPLVTGRGRFAADVSFPHQLHMRIVRSAHAHGKIRAIDVSAALALPGVFAVWTGQDTADIPPIDFREGRIEQYEPFRQPILAREYVRYVGEPVAAVFAESAYVAEDAADLVEIEVDELPPVLAPDQEPGEFLPGLATEVTIIDKGYGDVEAGFRDAHTVIELELKIGRHSGVPMETRGAIARHDHVRDILEMHGAAKVPHRTRDLLAQTLGRSPTSVHLFEGHTGGGFGIRGELYPEDVLVCLAALRLGWPVKWIEDRREHLMAANHSREQVHRVRAAVDETGFVLALEDEFFHGQGAYIRTHGSRVVDMTSGMLPGPYKMPAYRAVGHFRLTNKTPAATYRAPGRYESTFVRERMIDAIAERLKLDPIEVRRVNLIGKEQMPFERPTDTLGEKIIYDSGDYAALLDKTLATLDWNALQEALKARRAKGEAVGAGLAMFVEKSGIGPADGTRVTVDTTGAVELVTGGASLGQGFETAMAQICADALGVDYKTIKVIHGRTDLIAHGIGAHSSRASVMTGSATHIAASKVRDKAIKVASGLLQLPAHELDVVNGRVVRKDGLPGSPSMSLAEIARAVAPTSRTRGDHEPGLSAEGWFFTDHMVFPYGVHAAVVRVDRSTGAVEVERYLVAYDVGRAINPMMIDGQIHGGLAQGLGGALFEEFIYDPRGEPLAVTFADYIMVSAKEMPHGRGAAQPGCAEPAQSARHQGRRRGRHQRGWRRDRGAGDRRQAIGVPRRGHATAGDAATHEADPGSDSAGAALIRVKRSSLPKPLISGRRPCRASSRVQDNHVLPPSVMPFSAVGRSGYVEMRLLRNLDTGRLDQRGPFPGVGPHLGQHRVGCAAGNLTSLAPFMGPLKRGSCTALLTSTASRSTIGFGVFGWCQQLKPSSPSRNLWHALLVDPVGTSGMTGKTLQPDATASSLSLPPSDMALADGGPVSMTSMTPATRSVMAGAVPRYGTWLISVLVANLNISMPMCIAVPMPISA